MMQTELINLCASEMMSYCTAGNNLNSQKECRFFRKASLSDHCMHYRKLFGGHCDCVEAQREVRLGAV